MARPTFNRFRKKSFGKPGVKVAYGALAPVFKMKRKRIRFASLRASLRNRRNAGH